MITSFDLGKAMQADGLNAQETTLGVEPRNKAGTRSTMSTSSLWSPILLEAGSSKICLGPVGNETGVINTAIRCGPLGTVGFYFSKLYTRGRSDIL